MSLIRADLHLHSRASDESAEYLLRRFGFPDSNSDPQRLYDKLMAAGMTHVTFTDHNKIDSCLALSAHPEVFVSEEVTAYFPRDGCRVHLLLWNITPEQHEEIQEIRRDIYNLRDYLIEQEIVHAVAHPVYPADGKLRLEHVEKLILLFQTFEAVNGHRHRLYSVAARQLLAGLTPEKLCELEAKHDIAPASPEPWKKNFIGGSNDHSGLYAGRVWTEAAAENLDGFFAAVSEGMADVCGEAGGPLSLSHGLYNNIFRWAGDRFAAEKNKPAFALVERAFQRFMEGKDPTEFSLGEKLNFVTQGIVSGQLFDLARAGGASMWKQLSAYLESGDVKEHVRERLAGVEEPERRAFIMANVLVNELSFHFLGQLIEQVREGQFLESLQTASLIAPSTAALSPYLYAFWSQSPDRAQLARWCLSLAGSVPPELSSSRKAWATDTLGDVNGVTMTIQKMTAAAASNGDEIVVLSSVADPGEYDMPLKNFPPVGEFELPEYEIQKLSYAPMLEIIDFIEAGNFSEVIISTPGPVGLAALAAAKLLKLPAIGIYHTDFPQYVRILTDDLFMESLTWNYMYWFYAQCDLIFVNSEAYRQSWIERGIKPEKLAILPRGLDIDLFHPERRSPEFRRMIGADGVVPAVIYVGRVSKEKGLDILAQAHRKLLDKNIAVRLVVVGDGPFLAAMKKLCPEGHFTGYLKGEELAAAYASCDIFAFPSATDTFGNVVLEAQACGLPCVVSDEGGPKDLVEDGVTGFITRAEDAEQFSRGIERLLNDGSLRRRMSGAARQAVQNRSWPAAARQFARMIEERFERRS